MLERARRSPENVRAVSVVSLVNDVASELAYPVVPLFLTIVLGAPVAAIGLIEGVAEGAAVMLFGMAAPRNFGPEYTKAFDGLYPRLA